MGFRNDERPPSGAARRRRWGKRGRRVGAWGFALAAHGAVFLAMASAWPAARAAFDPQPIAISLVTLAPPTKPPPPTPVAAASAHAAPAKVAPARALARAVVTTATKTLPAAAVSAADAGVSDADLAGAETADSGDAAGRPCNMTRRVQEALRKDPLVRTAVTGLGGRAVKVWDGDWVWLQGEDGKGLTAVRQAMMWEIAFAPPACRAQPMHGLVVIAPATGTRIVVGLNAWRWSDLLTPHPSAARD